EQQKQLGKAKSDPGSEAGGRMQQTGLEAGRTAGQLKDIVDHSEAGKAFGPPLHEALSDAEQKKLADQLSKLSQAADDASKKTAAHDTKEELQKISDAFNKSLPALTQESQKNNPLHETGSEAFDRAMKELESLQTGLESGKPVSKELASAQQEDARIALMQSIPELFGSNEKAKALLAQIDADLKPNGPPVDLAALKKLTDQIQNFRAEINDAKLKKPDKEEMSHIDPSKLPPEYRDRVERYYRKLSEQ
ncbi:MAG: hypothetical protein WCH43_17165, partial [Verrucomicrobiota bacterium]